MRRTHSSILDIPSNLPLHRNNLWNLYRDSLNILSLLASYSLLACTKITRSISDKWNHIHYFYFTPCSHAIISLQRGRVRMGEICLSGPTKSFKHLSLLYFLLVVNSRNTKYTHLTHTR